MKNMACDLCPRACKVDRSAGERGICGETDRVKVARAALHMWEEPCISGKAGSGAVFFCGCALHCVFCQNGNIANGTVGKEITEERLAEIFLELQEKKANNINLVTAGQFVPQVVRALRRAKDRGLGIPVVYNTSSYENVDTIKRLEGLVDIYLPDYIYIDPNMAAMLSGARDYPDTAHAAIDEMVRQTGRAVFDENGLMKKGVIVRHLLLPGAVKNAKAVVKYVYETYGDTVWLSLMSQYTPLPQVENISPLNRKTTKREYERLLDYTFSLGVTNAFLQEGPVAEESFIPEFDGRGI